MKPTPESILAAALSLSEEDRLAMADKLVESVQRPTDPAVAAAWEVEIARRIQEIDEGRVKMVPGEEVMRKLREIIGGSAA